MTGQGYAGGGGMRIELKEHRTGSYTVLRAGLPIGVVEKNGFSGKWRAYSEAGHVVGQDLATRQEGVDLVVKHRDAGGK